MSQNAKARTILNQMRTTWLTPIITGAIGVAIGAHTLPLFSRVAPEPTSSNASDVPSSVEEQKPMAGPDYSHDQTPNTRPPERAHHLLESEPSVSLASFDDEGAVDTAVREANVIVQAALRRGAWTVDDGDRLREHYRLLPDAKRTELLSVLVVAVNRGDLTPTSPRFPF